MKFGTRVLVRRGSENIAPGRPGHLRTVQGVLVGARRTERLVRLLQDDPDAVAGPNKEGEAGCWSASAVSEGLPPLVIASRSGAKVLILTDVESYLS